jgi:hypothetical protein
MAVSVCRLQLCRLAWLGSISAAFTAFLAANASEFSACASDIFKGISQEGFDSFQSRVCKPDPCLGIGTFFHRRPIVAYGGVRSGHARWPFLCRVQGREHGAKAFRSHAAILLYLHNRREAHACGFREGALLPSEPVAPKRNALTVRGFCHGA